MHCLRLKSPFQNILIACVIFPPWVFWILGRSHCISSMGTTDLDTEIVATTRPNTNTTIVSASLVDERQMNALSLEVFMCSCTGVSTWANPLPFPMDGIQYFHFAKQHEELIGIYASQLHHCIDLFVHMMELRLNDRALMN
ncbi:uncharacterized protein LOC130783935 isoform X2 [Actinidia eriantha]|uniref:uncharacterized protein LOC130783935 isoform X2 n=1 Tax=Actinidia eriantha TaxID=165200 RepID=UPI0025870F39|nr:uncharacterized protein LOC130783935 isoform X2 [Actinidia eriantha]XP_057499715.1 uncharacterized protein LOC130783935 isoform X2 [Actinidia eriantha]XP_057499716.1 uncharacterized protein LOC130783935 isoform X2 [Actinidia eriantha]XP_057499717.1 uncharacterized protein LOC130783935 isoform X2 [Actinidia eriantha]XP_057499718.1 uncharacterized protein LOC130783935 isoform X2 [Actinidia eriantha]XP_057499719.1 uncharacterized protein LOC130783935 isoform X2 [Actinidia eriantha]